MRFKGDYDFLSNFYPCEIYFLGIKFPSAEHAYVAAKTTERFIRMEIANLPTPGEAKRFGRDLDLDLRPDWDDIKVDVMEQLILLKFVDQHPELGKRLAAIPEDIEIIEHNTWHDNFWGICECGRCEGGQNILGSLLQSTRKAAQ